MNPPPADKTDKTDKTPQPDSSASKAALRHASPAGQLAAHEKTVEAMLADGFDCDMAHYRRHVELARAELDRGHMDRARFHISRADNALTMMNYIHDSDRLRGTKTRQAARDGGEARRNNFRATREATIAEMVRLIDANGRGVSWAAKQAFKNGYGTSEGANVKAWQRAHRK